MTRPPNPTTERPVTLLALTLCLNSIALADVVCDTVDNTAVTASTPSRDFILYEDGTATHTPTNLMWSRCPVGQSWQGDGCMRGFAQSLNWRAALDAAELSSLAGYDDWRVPNVKELATIIETRCHYPASNAAVFGGETDHRFWTASPARSSVQTEGQAWFVNFTTGAVTTEGRNLGLSVRLVRTVGG